MHRRHNKEAHKEKREKGQAAMEFLLTYGWAILIVLIIIAALFYLGVLSPSKMLPGKCMFQAGFDCVDYAVNGDTQWKYTDGEGNEHPVRAMTFNLVNSIGKTAYVTGIKVTGKSADYMCVDVNLDCAEPEDIFYEGITITAERKCLSISKICDIFKFLYGPDSCPSADRFFKISPGSRLKGDLESSINQIVQTLEAAGLNPDLPTLSDSYMNIYCMNLPGPGERMNAQIEITYHTGDPSFTHVEYGELSTTVS